MLFLQILILVLLCLQFMIRCGFVVYYMLDNEPEDAFYYLLKVFSGIIMLVLLAFAGTFSRIF